MLWKFTNLNKHGQLRSRVVYSEGALTIGQGFGPFVAARRFRYQSRSPYFGILTSPVDGKKYLTPDWIEVLTETTVQDCYYEAPEVPKEKPQKWTFKSESSDKEYVVRRGATGNLTCNCWGFIAHKKCKHVKKVSGEVGDKG